MSKAMVLLSGGLDSATVLQMAKEDGHDLYAMTFRYGQRHEAEVRLACRLAEKAEVVKHVIVDINLRVFGGSALTSDLEVPKGRSTETIGSDIPITYVPARNTVFLAYATAWAEVLECDSIYIGANVVDYSGYPDCRPEYLAAFEKVANLGTRRGVEYNSIRVRAPILHMDKASIVREGLRLGVDYSLTLSCYDPSSEGRPCRECDACRLRSSGFAGNNVQDPSLVDDEVQE
jgi:7-cyano-7-deazaguanine synthase